jgi:hypothetical protein
MTVRSRGLSESNFGQSGAWKLQAAPAVMIRMPE